MSLRLSQAVSRLVTPALLAAGLAFGSGTNALATEVPEGKIYSDHVQCNEGEACKIDLHLTRGYRAFAQCQVCHGLTGEGSTIAPSLIEKLQDIDQERFNEVVTNGYTGQIGVMPGWKDNPNVMNHIEALYIYLMARSDGVLPGGRLERFDR
jgi:mono/diheme cytochrome c family protein